MLLVHTDGSTVNHCQEMKCPRDQYDLEGVQKSGYEAFRCPRCGGVFIELDQPAIPELNNDRLRPYERLGVECSLDQLALSPATGEPMHLFHFEGVAIDYCHDSNSLWLDAGELEKLMTRRSGEAVEPDSEEDEGSTFLGVIVDILAGLL